MVARTMRSGEMLMPRRSSDQILRADNRGDRRPLAGWVARGRAWRHEEVANTASLTCRGPPDRMIASSGHEG
jgi:hypothetical protein